MTTLTEFVYFPQLNEHIRRRIWRLVPHPTRVIGYSPNPYRDHVEQGVERQHSPGWNFCLKMQPKKTPVFALLHACRESREIWRHVLTRMVRNRNVKFPAAGNESQNMIKVHSEVLYVNHNTDILVINQPIQVYRTGPWEGSVFNTWNRAGQFDPFFGLIQTRILDVAIGTLPTGVEGWQIGVLLRDLPNLKSVTFLCEGSTPLDQVPRPPEIEDNYEALVPAADTEAERHELLDAMMLTELDSNKVRRDAREKNLESFSVDKVKREMGYIKAWLYHLYNGAQVNNLDGAIDKLDETAEAFAKWVDGQEEGHCPLSKSVCIFGRHDRDEMVKWKPPFGIYYKILGGREMFEVES